MSIPASAMTEEFTLKLSGSEVAVAVAALTHAIEDSKIHSTRGQFQEVHNKVVDQVNEQHERSTQG